jgi:class 3 adenylate cyclase
MIDWTESHWGEDAARESLRDRAPSVYNDPAFRTWWERYLRLSVSPGAAAALSRMNREIDVRPALAAVQAPALIIHANGDRTIRVANGRFLAKTIPNAEYIELDSIDHLPWVVDSDAETCLQAMERLVTGGVTSREAQQTRVLATLLYTDIVDSTARAARLGDDAWKKLVASHNEIAQEEVERARGRLIKTLGDGVLATFDGPARAIRCADAIRARVAPIGLEIRAGLHTGEVELTGDDVTGLATAIGSRVSSLAHGNEILVSSTVKDLVVGSGIEFERCGSHALKGVPGQWAIFRVTRA